MVLVMIIVMTAPQLWTEELQRQLAVVPSETSAPEDRPRLAVHSSTERRRRPPEDHPRALPLSRRMLVRISRAKCRAKLKISDVKERGWTMIRDLETKIDTYTFHY